jgi:hypothetical protein
MTWGLEVANSDFVDLTGRIGILKLYGPLF